MSKPIISQSLLRHKSLPHPPNLNSTAWWIKSGPLYPTWSMIFGVTSLCDSKATTLWRSLSAPVSTPGLLGSDSAGTKHPSLPGAQKREGANPHVSVRSWFCPYLFHYKCFVSLCFSFSAYLPPTGTFYLFIFILTKHMKLYHDKKNPSLVAYFRTFALDWNKRMPERSGGWSLSTHQTECSVVSQAHEPHTALAYVAESSQVPRHWCRPQVKYMG